MTRRPAPGRIARRPIGCGLPQKRQHFRSLALVRISSSIARLADSDLPAIAQHVARVAPCDRGVCRAMRVVADGWGVGQSDWRVHVAPMFFMFAVNIVNLVGCWLLHNASMSVHLPSSVMQVHKHTFPVRFHFVPVLQFSFSCSKRRVHARGEALAALQGRHRSRNSVSPSVASQTIEWKQLLR